LFSGTEFVLFRNLPLQRKSFPPGLSLRRRNSPQRSTLYISNFVFLETSLPLSHPWNVFFKFRCRTRSSTPLMCCPPTPSVGLVKRSPFLPLSRAGPPLSSNPSPLYTFPSLKKSLLARKRRYENMSPSHIRTPLAFPDLICSIYVSLQPYQGVSKVLLSV